MQEDLLHYFWKLKKFQINNLQTTEGELIVVKSVGTHNQNTGPDFFNAQVSIGNQLWAGNVEVHIKSSDWFVHNHEQDVNYDNVILHVVWEHDTPVYRNNNTPIPTLQLKDYVTQQALDSYQKLFDNTQTWINCQNSIATISSFTINNWLERLYFERLEQKAIHINLMLQKANNNWEAVLFQLLAKNFGLKVNADAFLSVANSFNFSVIQKQQSKLQSIEALLFGQANLLSTELQEPYYIALQKEYVFLKQKFKLDNQNIIPIQFFRLRPPNFPTIRLSQLANLFHLHPNLFSKILNTDTLDDYYNLFSVTTTAFWDTHYTFNKESKVRKKKITKSFIDLLLINTILPLKFCYTKQKGKLVDDKLLKQIAEIKSEKNSIVANFKTLKVDSKSALHSQALLQLKNNYCNKNQCLKCAIGNTLLKQN